VFAFKETTVSSRKQAFAVRAAHRVAANSLRAVAFEQVAFGFGLGSSKQKSRGFVEIFLRSFGAFWLPVLNGAGCPSAGGQRTDFCLRYRAEVSLSSLALPLAKPVWRLSAGISFAHAGGSGLLRKVKSKCLAWVALCRLTPHSTGRPSAAR